MILSHKPEFNDLSCKGLSLYLNVFLKKIFEIMRVDNLCAVTVKLHPDDTLYDTYCYIAQVILFDVSQRRYGR